MLNIIMRPIKKRCRNTQEHLWSESGSQWIPITVSILHFLSSIRISSKLRHHPLLAEWWYDIVRCVGARPRSEL